MPKAPHNDLKHNQCNTFHYRLKANEDSHLYEPSINIDGLEDLPSTLKGAPLWMY